MRAVGTPGQAEPRRPKVCVWGATVTSGTLKPGATPRSAVALWALPQPSALTCDPLGRTSEGREPRSCSPWVLVREGLGGVSLKCFQAQLCSAVRPRIHSRQNFLKIIYFCEKKVYLCSPGYPGICCIDQTGLKFRRYLPLPLKCWD